MWSMYQELSQRSKGSIKQRRTQNANRFLFIYIESKQVFFIHIKNEKQRSVTLRCFLAHMFCRDFFLEQKCDTPDSCKSDYCIDNSA